MSNTNQNHQVTACFFNGFTSFKALTSRPLHQPMPPSDSLAGSVNAEPADENPITMSYRQLKALLTQTAEHAVSKTLNKIENTKRHLLNERFRLKHVDAAKYLGVSVNTLARKRDLWGLVHEQEGNSRYYSKASLDTFRENRSI